MQNPAGTSAGSITRLNADGSHDPTFVAPSVGIIQYMEVMPDDKVLIKTYDNIVFRLTASGTTDTTFAQINSVLGTFAALPGGKVLVSNTFGGPNISRYNNNGSIDNTFNSPSFDCTVAEFKVQADGKIWACGQFSTVNDTPANFIARLNSDGTVDPGFASQMPLANCTNSIASINKLMPQPDGKILIAGSFTNYNGTPVKNFARLNANGTLDGTFAAKLDGQVNGIAINAAGNILLSLTAFNPGFEINLTYDGILVDTFIKLNSAGNLVDTQNATHFNSFDMIVDSNNQIAMGGSAHFPHHMGLKVVNADGNLMQNPNLFKGFNRLYLSDGSSYSVTATVKQADGKILVGGYFTTFNGISANRIIRLNADYSRDLSFNIGSGFENGNYPNVYDLALQPDGKILVSGEFTTYNGVSLGGKKFIRLNTDGTFDNTFSSPFSSMVQEMVVLADGKIIANVESTLRRMLPDGAFDPAFTPVDYNYASSIAVLPDGRILTGGSKVLRFSSDGVPDPTFEFRTSGFVHDMAIQADGKIIIAGSFSHYYEVDLNPIPLDKMARLTGDGTLDTTFDIGAGFDRPVHKILLLPDGKILAAGEFSRYNGEWANGIVRLLGGDSNLVRGSSRYDLDANGCTETDGFFPGMKFHIASAGFNGDVIGDGTGNYEIPLPAGSFTITPVLENPTYHNVSPASTAVTFPGIANPVVQDYCISANGSNADLEITVIPVTVSRPGFDATYSIVYKNKGTMVQSGYISFTYTDASMDYVSAEPSAISTAANTAVWNFTELIPFESRCIELVLNMNSPMESPAVQGGDTFSYTAAISSVPTDATPDNNAFTLNQTVVNAFDPNDKTCLEGVSIAADDIGNYMHYVIRFENTGTYSAQNITVRDMIDTNKFEISSLIPIAGSHPFSTRITEGNKVEFLFDNINLPFDDASNDGYVSFKIKLKSTLVPGASFSNAASIFFDYNAPIHTNIATTQIQSLGNSDYAFGNYFSLFPVPVSETLHLHKKHDFEVNSIEVYNMLGQVVLIVTNAAEVGSIDVSHLQSGNYFIKINSPAGVAATQFIKL